MTQNRLSKITAAKLNADFKVITECLKTMSSKEISNVENFAGFHILTVRTVTCDTLWNPQVVCTLDETFGVDRSADVLICRAHGHKIRYLIIR